MKDNGTDANGANISRNGCQGKDQLKHKVGFGFDVTSYPGNKLFTEIRISHLASVSTPGALLASADRMR